jgi:hypothetical protein
MTPPDDNKITFRSDLDAKIAQAKGKDAPIPVGEANELVRSDHSPSPDERAAIQAASTISKASKPVTPKPVPNAVRNETLLPDVVPRTAVQPPSATLKGSAIPSEIPPGSLYAAKEISDRNVAPSADQKSVMEKLGVKVDPEPKIPSWVEKSRRNTTPNPKGTGGRG